MNNNSGGVFSYYTYGVGFCVARFDGKGNAKASMRGTSDQYGSHAFFIVNQIRGKREYAHAMMYECFYKFT